MATTTAPERRPVFSLSAFPDVGDHVFFGICALAALSVVVLFGLLVVVVIQGSWEAMREIGVRFFVSADWYPVESRQEFGALAFVYGTLVTSALAMLIAVPLGVGTAAYLSEIAPGGVRRVVTFLIEMLAAIPSVVYGFWGVVVLAPSLQPLMSWFGADNTGGVGIFSAGLILSIMIVPYVTAVSFDVCRAVPASQREAALALGATRWQMIWSAVLPFARPGIIGACFLALGRAVGETMAVTMLIGNNPRIDWSLFAQGNTIASAIASEFPGASYPLYKSALTQLALVLLLVSIIVNSLARLMIWRVVQKARGSAYRRRLAWGAQLAETLSAGGRRLLLWVGLPALLAWALDVPLRGLVGGPHYLTFLTATAAFAVLLWLTARAATALRRRLVPDPQRYADAVNRLMDGILVVCVAVTVGPLFVILGYLCYNGLQAIDWQFFVNLPAEGGMANGLIGSLVLVGLASLFAVPVGVLAAIYLAEKRRGRLVPTVRFIGELLSGVPSIVIGMFVYTLLVRPTGHFSGWAGAFALGVMMIPIVMRASEEALKLVPEALRNASYALGASRWQTVVRVIVPAALPAIITGIFLAIARIGGETAPLLFTILGNDFFPSSPDDVFPAVPVLIYNYAKNADPLQQQRAWAAALVLLVVVMLLNFGIRALTGKRVVLAGRAD
jgi:phosphate transport system permease protein